MLLAHAHKSKFGLFFAKSNLEERITDEIEKHKRSFAEEVCVRNFDQKRILPARALWERLSEPQILEGGAGDLAIVKIRAKIERKIDQIEKILDEKFNFNKVAKAIQQPDRKKVRATQ